mmetsp:Transcript_71334/g.133430  ORF Transcript_71334/g.133430 Transcript_71334/m.133430 type:complete len:134 (+) Transcript_71334:95-496(+)
MAPTSGFWAKVKCACKCGKAASQDKGSAKREASAHKVEKQMRERTRATQKSSQLEQRDAWDDTCSEGSADLSMTSTLSISSWFSSPTMRNICTSTNGTESYQSTTSTCTLTFSQHQDEARTWRPHPPPLKQLS